MSERTSGQMTMERPKLAPCLCREIKPMPAAMQPRLGVVLQYILGNPKHFARFEALAADLGKYDPKAAARAYAAKGRAFARSEAK